MGPAVAGADRRPAVGGPAPVVGIWTTIPAPDRSLSWSGNGPANHRVSHGRRGPLGGPARVRAQPARPPSAAVGEPVVGGHPGGPPEPAWCPIKLREVRPGSAAGPAAGGERSPINRPTCLPPQRGGRQ